MSEPMCRTCYLATLTIDQQQRASQKPITRPIYLCAEHQAATDALTASIDWSTIQVARPLDSYTMLPFTPAAPEPRSAPGPSTGTPEPSQAASEAQVERACEVMHDAYEAAAAGNGWETQAASRKPWADVPEANKATMRAAVGALLDHLAASESR